MDPKGNKGTTHKLSGKTLFVLTGSILCQDRRRHNSILESARFCNLNIMSWKQLFLSIFRVIPIEMSVWFNMRINVSLCTITYSFSKFWIRTVFSRPMFQNNINTNELSFNFVCMSAVTSESSFWGEAFGTDLVPTYSRCKYLLNGCKFCSSNKAICSIFKKN